MRKEWREDQFDFKSVVETEDGYLLLTATVARTGILEYQRGDGSIRRELVLEEELVRDSSIGSLALKPITVEHPSVMVNKDNISELAVGKSLQKVRYMNGFVEADIIIDTTTGINAVRTDGLTQVSPGYFVELENTPGIHPVFGRYDAIQRNRKHNHIALTKAGRSGPEVSLHLDSMGVGAVMVNTIHNQNSNESKNGAFLMPQININGMNIDVADVATATVINEFRKDSEAARTVLGEQLAAQTARADAALVELTNLKEKSTRQDGELDELKGKFAALEATVNKDMTVEEEEEEEAKKKMNTDSEANRIVWYQARQKLTALASEFNVDSADTKTNAEIKRSIVAAHLGERFDSAMPEAQIEGAFTMILQTAETRSDSYSRAGKVVQPNGKPEPRKDEASAQAAYVANLTGHWKPAKK